MFHLLLDCLFPRTSLSGLGSDWITPVEFKEMKRVPVHVNKEELMRMGAVHLDSLVAASTYDESPLLRTAIHRYKYKRIRQFAEPLGRLLSDASLLLSPSEQRVLCPVPLHWTRTFSRGFNQSMLLALKVSRNTGIPLVECVRRVRPTGHQARRGKDARHKAMKHVFRVNGVLPAHVILIDDVATTCSTLEECARVLKEAGVKRVDGLVLALG